MPTWSGAPRPQTATLPGDDEQEATPEAGSDQDWEDETWEEESWEEGPEEESRGGRTFFYQELVLTATYSPEGVRGIPPDDPDEDHFELSPRPPNSYAGVDLIRTFSADSPINRRLLPGWLPLSAIDLHPRLVLDRFEEGDELDQLRFAPQDLWARFNPGGIDRLSLRVGQFVLPYGVNPPLAPRQKFILPLEAIDLGVKWDWGIDLKGPAGDHDWEIAATAGSGEGLHSTHLFRGSDRTSYLATARIGAPTYWDLQYGFSALYGDLPMIRGPHAFGGASISRWRTGLDLLYKYGTYLFAGAQVTYGQDGFRADDRFVMLTGGRTADVLGTRAFADWVVPQLLDLRLSAQLESIVRDLSTSDSDDTAAIFEISYSLTDSTRLVLDGRLELNSSMGNENNAIYITFIFYGR
ncbi:MAG: hypothetical protein ACE5GW_08630 [Planctomycetota bacterium]